MEVLQGDAATSQRVRDRLHEVDLFHFAGHAIFSGRGGWNSALPLAEQAQLTVNDILALERAPQWVVLSGCESGRTAEAAAESIGLAHAFLSSGTGAVVAAVRPVRDDTAAALVESFYENWTSTVSPGAALRFAQLELRGSRPEADWASFRIIER